MNLWLDDARPAPDGWVWAKTVDEAVAHLLTGEVANASLDYDLGVVPIAKRLNCRVKGLPNDPLAPTGYDLCLWMIEHDTWPTQSIKVHSANGVKAMQMCGMVDRYGPYDKRTQWIPEWD